eukprot:3606199-Rhodomonas_salina.1
MSVVAHSVARVAAVHPSTAFVQVGAFDAVGAVPPSLARTREAAHGVGANTMNGVTVRDIQCTLIHILARCINAFPPGGALARNGSGHVATGPTVKVTTVLLVGTLVNVETGDAAIIRLEPWRTFAREASEVIEALRVGVAVVQCFQALIELKAIYPV